MPSNLVMFPGSKNPEALEHQSNTITSEIIASIVHILNQNNIDPSDAELQHQLGGAIKLLKAVIDNQLGLDNPLKEEIKNLVDLVQKDI